MYVVDNLKEKYNLNVIDNTMIFEAAAKIIFIPNC